MHKNNVKADLIWKQDIKEKNNSESNWHFEYFDKSGVLHAGHVTRCTQGGIWGT